MYYQMSWTELQNLVEVFSVKWYSRGRVHSAEKDLHLHNKTELQHTESYHSSSGTAEEPKTHTPQASIV